MADNNQNNQGNKAEQVQDIHHQGIVLETVESIRVQGVFFLVFANPADPGNELFRILVTELVSADASGGMGTEELVQVNLSAAQDTKSVGCEIQVSPLIIVHFTGAGQTVHGKGRKNKDLVRLEQIKLVIHAHIFPTADMNIKLIIIVAVELRHLIGFTDLIMRLIALLFILIHGHEGRLACFSLYRFHDVPPLCVIVQDLHTLKHDMCSIVKTVQVY